MAGKPSAKPRVTRAPAPRTEGRDPGPARASLNADTRTSPGAVAFGATGATGVPAKNGPAAVPMRPGRGVRDRSSAATGSSLFQKADARNRMLGRRNRPTA